MDNCHKVKKYGLYSFVHWILQSGPLELWHFKPGICELKMIENVLSMAFEYCEQNFLMEMWPVL